VTKHKQWHISGWKAAALAPLAIPAVLIVIFAQRFLGLKKTADLTAAEVVAYLENFISGDGGDWDWDDFTSIPITDTALEAIRVEAAGIDPREDGAGDRLEWLLARAKEMVLA
jgi:hypothetical protein